MSGSAQYIYSNNALQPAINPGLARTHNVAIKASQTIAKGTVLGEVGNVNPTSTITITASTSGGSFKLTANTLQTAAISWNATNATLLANIQSAVNTTFGLTGGTPNVLVAAVALTAGIGTILLTGQNGFGAQPLAWTLQDSTTGGTGTTIASTTTGVTATGVYAAYSSTATDGTQTPKVLAQFDMVTDSSGNITFTTSGTGGGSQGETYSNAPVWVTGEFYTQDLVGLDTNAVTIMGSLIQGSVVTGILRIG